MFQEKVYDGNFTYLHYLNNIYLTISLYIRKQPISIYKVFLHQSEKVKKNFRKALENFLKKLRFYIKAKWFAINLELILYY